MAPSPAFTFAGAAGSLLKLSTTAGATWSATLDDLSGVTLIEWRIASTDETSAPDDYTLVTSGPRGSTVSGEALGEGTAGLLECIVNGGIDHITGRPSSALRARAKFYVPAANGREVKCFDEQLESGSYGDAHIINPAVRASGGGGGADDGPREIRYERAADSDALDESYAILSRFLTAPRTVTSASVLFYDDLNNPGAVDYARLQLVAKEPPDVEILIAELSTADNGFYGFTNEIGTHTPGLTIEDPVVPVGHSLFFRVVKEGAGRVLPKLVLFVEWAPEE